jgi:hypothetical protein
MVGLLVYQCWKAKRVLFRPYCDGPSELFQATAFWFRRSRQLGARKADADSPKNYAVGLEMLCPGGAYAWAPKSPLHLI